jgi:DNA polymerase V
VALSQPTRKAFRASRSFGRPVTALPELREAVAAHTTRAAEKLRRQHLATASLIVVAVAIGSIG